MSTRHVWSRQFYTVDEIASTNTLIRGTYSTQLNQNSIVGYCGTNLVKNRDEKGRITSYDVGGSVQTLYFGKTVDAKTYCYFVRSHSGEADAGNAYSGNGYWYGNNDYVNGGNYTAAVLYSTQTPPSSGVGELSFNIFTLTPGGYGTVTRISSADKNAYPNSTAGANAGNYWYKYLGSDTIDPTGITYPTDQLRPGDTVNVAISPRTPTYGGTISYLYQYQINGGSWVNIQTTTAASIDFTIPANAETIRFRARAQDNMGFTSSTYVTGASVTVELLNLWVGANGKARKSVELYVGVDGKARKVTAAYIGVNGKARRFL